MQGPDTKPEAAKHDQAVTPQQPFPQTCSRGTGAWPRWAQMMTTMVKQERKFTMKNRIVLAGILTFVFFCHASVTRAQSRGKALTPVAQILPMGINVRYVPQ
jgi:hypothetical protein